METEINSNRGICVNMVWYLNYFPLPGNEEEFEVVLMLMFILKAPLYGFCLHNEC